MKKVSPIKGKQSSMKAPNQSKGKVDSKPKQVTLSQKLADVNKQIAIKAKQADKSDSPTMKKPFDEVMKPSKTTERIVETPDGKGYQLLSEEEKKKVGREKKFEELGLLYFSHDEDELSLETITSDKSKGSNKSQGSKKSNAKPNPKQPVTPGKPSNVMPRSESKRVKKDELTPFHKDALSSAGSLKTPDVTGSSAGGWILHGNGNRTPNICDIFSPKTMGNMLGIRGPTPPNSDSDIGSAGSNSSNRYAVLQDDEEEEVSDATTDILPIDEIPESVQEGATLVQPDTNETPVNTQVVVTEPVVEDPQPDDVVSSKDMDFTKAESE